MRRALTLFMDFSSCVRCKISNKLVFVPRFLQLSEISLVFHSQTRVKIFITFYIIQSISAQFLVMYVVGVKIYFVTLKEMKHPTRIICTRQRII